MAPRLLAVPFALAILAAPHASLAILQYDYLNVYSACGGGVCVRVPSRACAALRVQGSKRVFEAHVGETTIGSTHTCPRLPARLVPRQTVRLHLPYLSSTHALLFSPRAPGFVGEALSFVECRKPSGATPAVVYNAAYKPELGHAQPATLCAGSALGSESNVVYAVDVTFSNSNCTGAPDSALRPLALDGSCSRCVSNCTQPFFKGVFPCKAGTTIKACIYMVFAHSKLMSPWLAGIRLL